MGDGVGIALSPLGGRGAVSGFGARSGSGMRGLGALDRQECLSYF